MYMRNDMHMTVEMKKTLYILIVKYQLFIKSKAGYKFVNFINI